jgi:hypothetical protein
MGMKKNTPNCARFFVCKKYTTFSTERIVPLRSVNKIFPESYDFAAINLSDIFMQIEKLYCMRSKSVSYINYPIHFARREV